jgi:hypothetical protein
VATSDTPGNKHTALGDMRGRSIRVSCLLDLASMGQKNYTTGILLRTIDPQAFPIFPFPFPLNKGELYNTFGGYAEEISAGHLCFHTDTSCSVLFNLRIYGIHGLAIGETEFIGGLAIQVYIYLVFSSLLSFPVARSHRSVRVDHS